MQGYEVKYSISCNHPQNGKILLRYHEVNPVQPETIHFPRLFDFIIADAIKIGRFGTITVFDVNTEFIFIENNVPAPAATKVPLIEILKPTGIKDRWLMVSSGFIRKVINMAPPTPSEASGL